MTKTSWIEHWSRVIKGLPVRRDCERFAKLAPEPRAEIPEGYTAPLCHDGGACPHLGICGERGSCQRGFRRVDRGGFRHAR